MSGTISEAMDTVVNKTDRILVLMELIFWN